MATEERPIKPEGGGGVEDGTPFAGGMNGGGGGDGRGTGTERGHLCVTRHLFTLDTLDHTLCCSHFSPVFHSGSDSIVLVL